MTNTRQSLNDTYTQVRHQFGLVDTDTITLEAFDKFYDFSEDSETLKPFVRGICLNIAEILRKPPQARVKINGEIMEAWEVQEVFYSLDVNHLIFVYDSFQEQSVSTRIISKKAYLTTMLYNSFFELDAHNENQKFY